MATINQLVRKPRKSKVEKKRRAGSAGLSAAAGGLHPGLHDHTEKAEFGVAKGVSCAFDQRVRGNFLYWR